MKEYNKTIPVDEKTGYSENYQGQSRPNCHNSKDWEVIWENTVKMIGN